MLSGKVGKYVDCGTGQASFDHAQPCLPNLQAAQSHDAAPNRLSPPGAVQLDRSVQFRIPPQTSAFPTSPCMCSPTAGQSRSLSSGGSWHCFGTPTPGQNLGAVVSTMLHASSLGAVPLGISKQKPNPRPGGQEHWHEPPPPPAPALPADSTTPSLSALTPRLEAVAAAAAAARDSAAASSNEWRLESSMCRVCNHDTDSGSSSCRVLSLSLDLGAVALRNARQTCVDENASS